MFEVLYSYVTQIWGACAEQGGILWTSFGKMELKRRYFRMFQPQLQPHANAVSQDQQPPHRIQQQDCCSFANLLCHIYISHDFFQCHNVQDWSGQSASNIISVLMGLSVLLGTLILHSTRDPQKLPIVDYHSAFPQTQISWLVHTNSEIWKHKENDELHPEFIAIILQDYFTYKKRYADRERFFFGK